MIRSGQLAWLLEQSDGHWFLDRGKQSGRMLSGLERNYLSIVVAYVIAAIGAGGYQVVVGFDVPAAARVAVAENLDGHFLALARLDEVGEDGDGGL